MFTIKENMNVDTTITDFNELNEIINLEDFEDIRSTGDLVYSSSNPATISFDNNQNLILQGVTSSELYSKNFIFYEDDSNNAINQHTIQNLIIISVAAVVGTCLLCCGAYGAYRFGKYLWPAAAAAGKMTESVVEFADTAIKNPLPGEAGVGMVDVGGDFGHA
jgi:hypothetical protein